MKPSTDLSPRERAALIYQAATLVAVLLPYTDAIESDAFTSGERARFRELAGNGRVFALAESLRPLCSAEAHALNRARATGVALTVIDTRTGRTTSKTFPKVRPARARRKP